MMLTTIDAMDAFTAKGSYPTMAEGCGRSDRLDPSAGQRSCGH